MPDLETPTEGRSQFLLTCDSVDVVLIDRETLEELNWFLVQAIDGLEECELWQDFISAAERCLRESTETRCCEVEELERPIKSAMLFIESWSDKSPDVLSVATHKLSQAQKVLHMVLTASKMGGRG
ncbi:hypothetical protein QUB56_04350 [Microcoleus sp. AR_TQ3_B6]|uniref:hypothetical protein n=1 Tax=Microcoleus sp. AR_TQ3_B6 TaxID=3055284 RepID=UPI002FCFC724